MFVTVCVIKILLKVYLRTLPNALHGAELDSRFMIDIIAFYTASQSTNLTRFVFNDTPHNEISIINTQCEILVEFYQV